jgi:hypothetical protein
MIKTLTSAPARSLGLLCGLLLAGTLATGCFGGSFAFAVMPTAGAQKVSCAPGQVKVKGYWDYQGNDYVWVMGRCVQPKGGCKWIPGHYKTKRRGNVKIKTWKAGKWNCGKKKAKIIVKPKVKVRTKVVVKPKVKVRPKVVVKPKVNTPKIIVVNPPAPKSKVPSAKKGKVWISGHYAWNAKTQSYKWINGRFKKMKAGKRWIKGRYKVEIRGNYKVKIWIPGSWR